jgi:hypothetical protein
MGNLNDRFGRRSVLLSALFALGVDYRRAALMGLVSAGASCRAVSPVCRVSRPSSDRRS